MPFLLLLLKIRIPGTYKPLLLRSESGIFYQKSLLPVSYTHLPKPNMYQSLHTTLIGSNGQPFEIQIRTYEMHRTAEYGIAAHWKYKESGSGQVAAGSEEAKLSWLRQILEWQKEADDGKEFLSLIKNCLLYTSRCV